MVESFARRKKLTNSDNCFKKFENAQKSNNVRVSLFLFQCTYE